MTETIELPADLHPDTPSRMIRRLNTVWMQLFNPRLQLRERSKAIWLLDKWRRRFARMLARLGR